MTQLLYLDDVDRAYRDSFRSRVVKVHGGEQPAIELDQTLFYPTGGGQTHDIGFLSGRFGTARVVSVAKKGPVLHAIEGDLPAVGDEVEGHVDWARRYANMRMHTMQHLVSGLVQEIWGARTVGNNIEPDRARIDFNPISFDEAMVRDLADQVDSAVAARRRVYATLVPRSEVVGIVGEDRCDLSRLPKSVEALRVVTIEGVDHCPCGGTHVGDTGELGRILFERSQNKGAGTQRLAYSLAEPLVRRPPVTA